MVPCTNKIELSDIGAALYNPQLDVEARRGT